jgi:glycosyltransferase involved in cell wall biosynthesis
MDSKRGLPVLALFQSDGQTIDIKTRNIGAWEPLEFDIRRYYNDDRIYEILAEIRPQVIISIGENSQWNNLLNLPFEDRRKWISFQEDANPIEIGEAAYRVFINAAVLREDRVPLISVFTPVYRIGEKLLRPYTSLLHSSYNNWEWVIYDDSDDNDETWNMLVELSKSDHRIKIFRGKQNSGRVGETKFYAANLCQGQILLELDHDDQLTENALQMISKAYLKFPDAGFYYTDCTEVYEENGKCVVYGDGFAMGYGKYKVDWYKDRSYLTHISCNINPRTIRHIVGVPNHIRAWRADVYKDIHGHSTLLGVCDDYEIIIRTFLKTKFVRIAHLGYIQWMNAGGDNTQNYRRQEIQRLVRFVRERYDRAIHNRFIELGVHDDAWSDDLGWSSLLWTAKPDIENFVNYIWDPLLDD